jgi:hypothetical protein
VGLRLADVRKHHPARGLDLINRAVAEVFNASTVASVMKGIDLIVLDTQRGVEGRWSMSNW